MRRLWPSYEICLMIISIQISHSHVFLISTDDDASYVWSRRDIHVVASGSEETFPHPNQVRELIKDFVDASYLRPQSLEDVARIHYNFVKIHPFVDGNGRIARLLMNIWLIALWYFPIIIPIVTRHEYISSLQGNDFDIWYRFFVRQVIENHKDYVRFFTK